MSATGDGGGVGLKPLAGHDLQNKVAEEFEPEALTGLLQGFGQSEGKQPRNGHGQDPDGVEPPKITKAAGLPTRDSFVASAGNADLAIAVMALRKETLPTKPAVGSATAPAAPAAKAPIWNLLGNGGQRAASNLQSRGSDHLEAVFEFISERICGKPYETRKEKEIRQFTELAIQDQIMQTSRQQSQQQQARVEVQQTQEAERIKEDSTDIERARTQYLQRQQKLQEIRPATSAMTQSRANTVSSGAGSDVKTTTRMVEQQDSQYNQTGALVSSSATQVRDSVTRDDLSTRAPGDAPGGRPRDKH